MILCKPERNVKQARVLIIGCAIICIVAALFSSIVQMYKWVFQLIFLIVLTVGIFNIIRYTLTEMTYKLTPESFSILKTVGKKTTPVCSLMLSETVFLGSAEEYQKVKKNQYISRKYNYCQNITKDCFYYVCLFNGKYIEIKFEPNAPFVSEMHRAIDESKKEK